MKTRERLWRAECSGRVVVAVLGNRLHVTSWSNADSRAPVLECEARDLPCPGGAIETLDGMGRSFTTGDGGFWCWDGQRYVKVADILEVQPEPAK